MTPITPACELATRPRRHEGPLGFVTTALWLCGFVALSVTPAFAQASQRPAVGSERPFKPAPAVERTLPNGLVVIVARHPTVPKVSMMLSVRSGLAADPAAKTGVASLTADAIQEGTKTRDSRRIRQEAFGMGASLSASVGQDASTITVRGLSEFTPGLIALLADVAMNPTFPAGEVSILKAQTAQSLQQQMASPQFLALRTFRQTLFGGHPYARVTTTPDVLKTLTRDDLAAFHADHYRPNNAFLLVVGDVQPGAVFAAAEKAFGGWARGDVPAAAFPAPPPLDGRKVVFVQRPNSVQSSITVGNFAVPRNSPEWYADALANVVFAGSFDSRLVMNIREAKGYTYSPQAQLGAFARAGFYRIAADVRNDVTGPTLKEVYYEIDRMRNEGVPAQELAGSKQYMRGTFVISSSTQGGLAQRLNDQRVFGLPQDYLETYQAKIAALTPEHVKTASQSLLGSEKSVIVIVGDYPTVKDQLGAFSNITFVDVAGNRIPEPGAAK